MEGPLMPLRASARLRWFKWTLEALLVPVLLAVLFVAVFGWNWLRAPLERLTARETGRALVISGDLTLYYAWPAPRLHASGVSFANPSWAQEGQMLTAQSVDITLDLPQLLRGKVAFPKVRLEHAVVYLEQGTGGRKSWLLDLKQKNERAVIAIGQVTLSSASLGYDDVQKKTRIRAELSTQETPDAGAGLRFSAQGSLLGQALQATGRGGPVLALRDLATPYALSLDATLGRTSVQAEGSITGLVGLAATDMRLALRGDSLEQFYVLLGIPFPATHAYSMQGQLLHRGTVWRYDAFTGRIGASDMAGSLQVDLAGKRPALSADLASRLLDLNDLGSVIGARAGTVAPAVRTPAAQARVLPDLPFRIDRWNALDAEVQLRARTLLHAAAQPLENLVTHLSLRDAVLTLDPLSFGLAGGQLTARISLDGRSTPLQARAQVQAHKILLARLFPTLALNRNSVGQVNGELDLSGQGNSVARMLATSSGKLGLVVSGGAVSKLMMERAGLHLWEILALNLSGDRLVKLRCAVADFDVSHGSMHAAALVLDTEITTLVGSGSIDLAQEKLDLTLNQKTKATSPLALRSPIHVRGNFAQPEVQVDKGRMAARTLGALGLGLVNPLLALLPLVDAGPGHDSDCGQLVREAEAVAPARR
jgi:AsmA protein